MSTESLNSNVNSKRKRAPVACTHCHARKVRCNVSELGPPCTNCRLDAERCDVRRRQRNAPPRVDSDRLVWSSDSNTFLPAEVLYSAYPFVYLKNVHKLPQEDVQYLNIKGCVYLPSKPILGEFISQYFRSVHPSLPVLNEKQFWHILQSEDSDEDLEAKIPLFVIHAMLYVTSGFMPAGFIKKVGYTDVKQTRDIFYRRAKVLYDLNTETSHYYKAVGALLLTYRFSPDDKQAGSIWLSIALQNAQAIQAHRFQDLVTDRESRDCLKRLWWCIFLRDKIIALGLRRPMQISSTSFKLPDEVLTEEDFADEIHESMVHDAKTKTDICRVMTSLCRLAIILTDVLTISQGILAADFTPAVRSAGTPSFDMIYETKESLRAWRRSSYIDVSSKDEFNFPVLVLSNMTLTYYHASFISLANVEIVALSRTDFTPIQERKPRLQQVSQELDAAVRASETLVVQFTTYGIVEQLPVTGMVYMTFPLLLRVLNYCLDSNNPQGDSPQYTLSHYTEVIRRTLARYEGARDIPHIIVEALASVGITTGPSSSKGNIMAQLVRASGRESPQLSRRPSLVKGLSSSWQDLIVTSPRDYLRLSGCLDLALASGEIPTQETRRGSGSMEDIVEDDGDQASTIIGEADEPITSPRGTKAEPVAQRPGQSSRNPASTPMPAREQADADLTVIPDEDESDHPNKRHRGLGEWPYDMEAQVAELFETLASVCYS